MIDICVSWRTEDAGNAAGDGTGDAARDAGRHAAGHAGRHAWHGAGHAGYADARDGNARHAQLAEDLIMNFRA